jgi:predicted KAP-like P-loop ATPase
MWSDNETKRDLINFRHVADIVAERIVGAAGEPLSIGISGSWGVGKSSMMKLLRTSLESRDDVDVRFVEFNAWLYQNYDDARAALMEAITQALLDHADDPKTTVSATLRQKILKQFSRINKLRTLGLMGAAALDFYTHHQATGLLAGGVAAFSGLTDGQITAEDVDKTKKVASDAIESGKKLLKDPEKDETSDKPSPEDQSPRKMIQAFRDDLEETLQEMKVTLVILIDDLDRCLPKTAIGTLEAMRLFLFLKHTAFVIAADEAMIREAVRTHFDRPDLSEDLVTNYFDKLIQLPIRVPPLGTQDVRAYLMMLFIDNAAEISPDKKEQIRTSICGQLSQTWKGGRVDKAFVLGAIGQCSSELRNRISLAERIAPILTTSSKIAGNPRLIKRFLNTLSLRSAMARVQGVDVEEEVLVKLLLFERVGDHGAYTQLLQAVNDADDGKPEMLWAMEARARGDQSKPKLEVPWSDPFPTTWLAMDPPLAGLDLRGATYVSRENHPIISRADELSSEAVEALELLLKLNSPSPSVTALVRALSTGEAAALMDKVIGKARQETSWGTPDILFAATGIIDAAPAHTTAWVAFMSAIPAAQIKPNIVARIGSANWGPEVLTAWVQRGGLTRQADLAIKKANG